MNESNLVDCSVCIKNSNNPCNSEDYYEECYNVNCNDGMVDIDFDISTEIDPDYYLDYQYS